MPHMIYGFSKFDLSPQDFVSLKVKCEGDIGRPWILKMS